MTLYDVLSCRSSAEQSGADQASANFTPERFPILARHWFGLRPAGTAYPPKRTAGPRSLAPGELVNARELRNRGLHLRLVGDPSASPPKTSRRFGTKSNRHSHLKGIGNAYL